MIRRDDVPDALGIFFVPAIFYLVEKWSGAEQEPFRALPTTGVPAPGD